MRASTARASGFICIDCGDELNQDKAGRGFVRHKKNPHCLFEKGLKDDFGSKPSLFLQSAYHSLHFPLGGNPVTD